MNTKRVIATSQPFLGSGTGVISAFSIFSGASRAVSRSPKGFEKNAFTLLSGTQLSRVISIGLARGLSAGAAWRAARKSPYEQITIIDVGRPAPALPAAFRSLLA